MNLDFLQNIDPGLLILIAGGCGLLCVVLVVISTLFQVFGTVFEVFTSLFEFVFGLAGGGPLGGCGCLFAAVGCGACALVGVTIANVLTTCGTPEAVNFCRLFGR
jgi:hypothetical protein